MILENLHCIAVETLSTTLKFQLSTSDVQDGRRLLIDPVEDDNFMEAAVLPKFWVFKLQETKQEKRAQI